MSEGLGWLRCAAVAVAAAAALAAPPPGGAGGAAAAARPGPARGEQSAQGVVQSVSARAVVLKRLDGSSVRVPVSAQTRVLVDGKTALLGDVKPGFLVSASWKAGTPTTELQALSPHAAAALTTVRSVLADAVVVTAADGTTVRIRVGAKTRVFLDGRPATLRDIRPGFTLVTPAGRAKNGKPTRELRFLRPS